MKKILIFVLGIFLSFSVFGQNTESLQTQAETITINNFSSRLEKLLHDYEYMSCEYKLSQTEVDFKNFSQDIIISANELLIDVYNGRYDRDLYELHSEKYDVYCDYYDTLKEKFQSVKSLVTLRMASSNFSDGELAVLDAYFNTLEKSAAAIDVALHYYNAVIQAYKKKR